MASLQCSEVITLALFGQWIQFKSERAFYRYAQHHLQAAFPQLPDRSQFNRLVREQRDAITVFGLYLVQLMQAQACLIVQALVHFDQDHERQFLGRTAGMCYDAARWLCSPARTMVINPLISCRS